MAGGAGRRGGGTDLSEHGPLQETRHVAEAGILYYWRIERGVNGLPVVHKFYRGQGGYLPVARHEGVLRTALPYPIEIDLAQLLEL